MRNILSFILISSIFFSCGKTDPKKNQNKNAPTQHGFMNELLGKKLAENGAFIYFLQNDLCPACINTEILEELESKEDQYDNNETWIVFSRSPSEAKKVEELKGILAQKFRNEERGFNRILFGEFLEPLRDGGYIIAIDRNGFIISVDSAKKFQTKKCMSILREM